MPLVGPGQQLLRRNTFAQHPAKKDDEKRGDDAGGDLRRALAENFRDQDDAQRVQPGMYPRQLNAVYTEPFYLGLLDEPRVGILLCRVRNEPSDEVLVSGPTAVFFVWDGVQQRAVIPSMPGLVLGNNYRFNFLVVG